MKAQPGVLALGCAANAAAVVVFLSLTCGAVVYSGHVDAGAPRHLQTVCQPGFFFSVTNVPPSCQVCPIGSYCPGATNTSFLCPAGRFGSSVELKTPDCTGPCAPGYFCPNGSTLPDAASNACGDWSVYCPLGTGTPVPVETGYYGNGSITGTTNYGQLPCPPGSYCIDGVKTPCGAGTYSNVPLLSGACSNVCPTGKYCPLGSTEPLGCPGGYYTATTGKGSCDACPMGYFCPANATTTYACPAGRYGDIDRLASENCTGVCEAGYFCPPGSSSSRMLPCGTNNQMYCPAGTPTVLTVPPGAYATGNSPNYRTGYAICEPGYYCTGGEKMVCPAGSFGAQANLSSMACSGPCLAGYICPNTSEVNNPVPCGAVNLYCPTGSDLAKPVANGYFSTPVTADVTTRTGQAICQAGTYCIGGVQHLCERGTFSSSPGRNTTCTDLCSAGYICSNGSAVPNPPSGACNNTSFYCPAGATAARPVGIGNYSVADVVTGLFVSEAVCPIGSYCVNGQSFFCPAGTYGDTPGSSSVTQCLNCTAGYYCPANSTTAEAVPCGGPNFYCPPASGAPRPVPTGMYTTGGANNLTRTTATACEPGSYCAGGEMYACPAGTYGNASMLSTRSCSGVCPAAYYCPAGTINATSFPCGNSTVYCPVGSSAPTLVPPGYTGLCSNNGTACTDIVPCVSGSYCVNGTSRVCPAGYFGCSTHLSASTCNGQCAAGYYCTENSTSSVQNQCGFLFGALASSVYCKSGSSNYTFVQEGYYSIGGNSSFERTGEAICDAGFYCQVGQRIPCPSGRYGSTMGLNSSLCSGVCADGYLCPNGSLVAASDPCPVGSYCTEGVQYSCPTGTYGAIQRLKSAAECTLCPAGTYNPVVNGSHPDACLPCRSNENSLAGSTQCWPGIVAISAEDLPPIVPGLSVGDVVLISFSSATNQPPVANTAQLANLISFSSSIGQSLAGEWLNNGQELQITVLDVQGISDNLNDYQVKNLQVSLLASGGLRDASSLSPVHPTQTNITMTGNWGLPTMPIVIVARAFDSGNNPGLSVNDTLVLSFDQRVLPLPVSTKADLDKLLSWSAAPWSDYTGQWDASQSSLTITFTAFPTNGAVPAAAVAVGNLQFAVNVSAGLTTFDGESVPSNFSGTVSSGSWGDLPRDVVVAEESPTRARVLAFPPSFVKTGYTVLYYCIQWSRSPAFDDLSSTGGSRNRSATSAQDVSFQVVDLTPNVPYYFRVAASSFNPSTFNPFYTLPAPLTLRLPGIVSVSAAGVVGGQSTGGVMATGGGQSIRVFGVNLGSLSPAGLPLTSASLWYSNDRFTYNASSCTVSVNHTEVTCLNAPGVGMDYRFWIQVDGVVSNASTGLLSYAAPSLSSFAGIGADNASTFGGDVVNITGSNFGFSLVSLDSVVYRSQATGNYTFHARNCSISVPNEVITCYTAPGAGKNHEWTVVVANQSSSSPTTYYKVPGILHVSRSLDDNASFVGDLASFNTSGSEDLFIWGTNFGPRADYIDQLYYANPLTNDPPYDIRSTIQFVNHTLIHCKTVAGTGVGYVLYVAAGGQLSAPSNVTISYGAPQFASSGTPSPASITSDGGQVTLLGTNFGAEPHRVAINVGGVAVTQGYKIAQAHRSISFECPPFEVAEVVIVLTINGQSCSTTLFIDPPRMNKVPSMPVEVPLGLYDIVTVKRLLHSNVLAPLVRPDTAASASAVELTPTGAVHAGAPARSLQAEFGVFLKLEGLSFGNGNNTVVTMSDVLCDKPDDSVFAGWTPPVAHAYSQRTIYTVCHARNGTIVVSRAGIRSEGMKWDISSSSPSVESCKPQLGTATNPNDPCYIPTVGGLLTIKGSNFYNASRGNVSIYQVDAFGDPVVPAVYMPHEVVSWTQTEIIVAVGAGQGTRFVVRVTSRSLESLPSVFRVHYNPPVVVGIYPLAVGVPGGVVNVLGQDFGQSGSVTIGGKPCPVLSWSNSTITCVAAMNNVSSDVIVTVAGQVSAPGAVFLQYAAPVVHALSATNGRTAGGDVITVSGAWFGFPYTSVRFVDVTDMSRVLPCVIVANRTVVGESDMHVDCRTPSGGGAGLFVTVYAGDPAVAVLSSSLNITASTANLFSYDPPFITDITTVAEKYRTLYMPPSYSPSNPDEFSFRPSRPGQNPFILVISGDNFAGVGVVTVGNQSVLCPPAPLSLAKPGVSLVSDHTTIYCMAPSQPADGNASVVVTAFGLRSQPFLGFMYDGPNVTVVTPNLVDAFLELATEITIQGLNFGALQPPILPEVMIGPYPCVPVNWLGDDHLQCTLSSPNNTVLDTDGKALTQGLIVGTYVVSVSVFGRMSRSGTVVVAECFPGFYGQPNSNETCTSCRNILGSACNGHGQDPISLPGYFRLQDQRTSFQQCTPVDACLGGVNSTCAVGYVGQYCAACDVNFYRLSQACAACPNMAWLLILGFVLAVLAVAGFAFWAAKKRINLVGLAIGVDFLQIVSMFASFNFKWPYTIKLLYSGASSVNFNIELFAPECSVKVTYAQKFFAVELIPTIIIGSVLVLGSVIAAAPFIRFGFGNAVRWWRGLPSVKLTASVSKALMKPVWPTLDNLLGIVFSGLYYTYFMVVKTALDVFDCQTNAQGETALHSNPNVLCSKSRGQYSTVYPFAVLAMCIYGAGVPTTFGLVLFRYRGAIRADQELKARGEGNSDVTNPNLWVRKRFRKLYEDFKPETAAWRMVLMARKFFLAWASIMFNSYPMFQASFSVFVIFVSYMLHARFQPFLPRHTMPEDFVSLQRQLKDARAKERDMVASLKGTSAAPTPPKRMLRRRRQSEADLPDATSNVITFVFNYNGLESAFLISAMFILLSGMIFDSASFAEDSPGYIFLTVLVAILLLGSMLLFMGLLSFELYRSVKFAAVLRKAEQFEEDSFRARRELHTTSYNVKDFSTSAEYEPTLSFGADDVHMEGDDSDGYSDDDFGSDAKKSASVKGAVVNPLARAISAADAAAGITGLPRQQGSSEAKELNQPRPSSVSLRGMLSVIRRNKPPPPSPVLRGPPGHRDCVPSDSLVVVPNVLQSATTTAGRPPVSARSPGVYPVSVPPTPPRTPLNSVPGPGIAAGRLRQAASQGPLLMMGGSGGGESPILRSASGSFSSVASPFGSLESSYLLPGAATPPPLTLTSSNSNSSITRMPSARSAVVSDVVRRRPPPPPVPAPPPVTGADSGAGERR